MKKYIGTKIIKAEPMNFDEFNQLQGGEPGTVMPEEGYKVIYPDGYISWSPKHTFETAYRQITPDEMTLMLGITQEEYNNY